MIEVLSQTRGDLVAFKAMNKLTEADYETLVPLMEKTIKDNDHVRLYMEMVNFEGWELKAMWEDIKFDLKHLQHFHKVAMVGDKNWENWMTQFMRPFIKGEVKFFAAQDRNEALAWITD